MNLLELMPWCCRKPFLQIRHSGEAGEESVTLRDFPATFGRGEDADLLFDDAQVSRVHCLVELVDGRFFIRDLESSNGTQVNGHAVELEPLHVGDHVMIGLTRIIIDSMRPTEREQ